MIQMEMKVDGLEELQKRLKDLENRAKNLDGRHKVPLSELFTDSFMTEHTPSRTIDAFFQAGGFVVSNEDDFRKIPVEKLDEYIKSVTKFAGWEDLTSEAVKEWTAKQLDL